MSSNFSPPVKTLAASSGVTNTVRSMITISSVWGGRKEKEEKEEEEKVEKENEKEEVEKDKERKARRRGWRDRNTLQNHS